jgi:surface protein
MVNTALAGSPSDTFVLPLDAASSYDFIVNWGDGNIQTISGTTLTGVTKTYSTSGTYQVRIRGVFPRIFFNNTGDRLKITNIMSWGNIEWASFNNAFRGCSNMNVTATDTPNLNNVINLLGMFQNCSSLVGNSSFNNWNTSNITNMSSMFASATSFNQPIGNWNVSNVTSLAFMFQGASVFNQNIGLWDTSKVNTMSSVFSNAFAFNQPIGLWNTSSVTNMASMFQGNIAFNQPIGLWDTSLVASMGGMFQGASAFNQPLGSWNVSNVTNMFVMFEAATSFNQNISSWNTSNVTNMSFMFATASAFNQNIGSWTLRPANVNLGSMLNNCGMTTENYSRTLIGWANSVLTNGNLPSARTLGAVGRTYDCVDYTIGQTFNNAVAARDYLDLGTPAWTFNGDSQSGLCPSPTPTTTPTNTPTPSITPTETPTPTTTETPTPTPTITPTPTSGTGDQILTQNSDSILTEDGDAINIE